MSTVQRRALADMIPTTEVIKDAVTYPRVRLGEPLGISPERFEAWLARVRREAKAEALIDAAEDLFYDRDIDRPMYGHRELYDRADRIKKGNSNE